MEGSTTSSSRSFNEEEATPMDKNNSNITVSPFDFSVENHFKAMNTIRKLCESGRTDKDDEIDIQQFNSRISFLKFWNDYKYNPRNIRFSCDTEDQKGKEIIGEVNLPQFSSATVPKTERMSSDSSKDFVLYVGGHVWGLDWCPNVHQQSDSFMKCEYLAVAAHPPGSSYHKIGAPLTGRGIVQIWCILHSVKEENLEPVSKSQRSKTRKQVTKDEVQPLKKPRGRPKKVSVDDSSRGNQMVEENATQSCNAKEEKLLPSKKARGRPRKHCSTKRNDLKESSVSLGAEIESVSSRKTRGRPKKQRPMKKKAINEATIDLDIGNALVPELAVDLSQVSSGFLALTEGANSTEEHALLKDCDLDDSIREKQVVQEASPHSCNVEKKIPSKKTRGRPRRCSPTRNKDTEHESVPVLASTEANRSTEEGALLESCDTDSMLEKETLEEFRSKMSKKKRKMIDKAKVGSPADDVYLLTHDEDRDLHADVFHENKDNDHDASASPLNVANNGSLEFGNSCVNPLKDVSLPRVVLCLAHNGKVTWDVKWRPPTGSGTDKHCIGYLAVLLGNGSLEVWEVPSPRAVEVLYTGCKQERTDPRFVKLEPVFRCSKLKSGDRHSIPLTVEWSTASPHDLLLAGCHDGTVALWKFSVSCLSQDTRPLLCFSADTLPIRALAWAPDASDEESANIVVTAGDGGVRFWDIRDPHRPLWDVNPVRRFIYSLDWLQDPRCVIMSFDDGTLRILSLSKAAYDVPVTGRPFVGTQQQGLHSYFCSPYPIWSVQASRLTGQVVYCSADGSVLHFQLTSKAVDKDPSRNRAPHFLCGSLTEEDGCLTLNAPLPDIPLPIKKPLKECEDRSIYSLLNSNQSKRANDQTPDREPLDLIYNGDPSFQIDSGDTVTAPESKTTSKKSKKIPDKTLVQVDNFHKEDNQEQSQPEYEVLSPKIVAMHRVRWNMNKGSDRWLCYGGAAGIIRCQEIFVFPTVGCSLVKK